MIQLLCFRAALAAEPLYAEPARLEELAAAVDALWPGDHLAVLPRPELVERGFVWDGGHLLMVAEGRVTYVDAPDAETAVALARAWCREPPAPAPWSPPPPAEPAPMATVLPPPDPVDREVPVEWSMFGTVGLRQPMVGWSPEAMVLGVGALDGHFDARAQFLVGLGSNTGVYPLGFYARTGQKPPPTDIAAVELVGGWNLGAVRRGPRPHAGPVVVGSMAVVSRSYRAFRGGSGFTFYRDDIVWVPGVGAGLEVWLGRGPGLRTTAGVRPSRGGPLVAFSLDLMFAPIAKDSAPSPQSSVGEGE